MNKLVRGASTDNLNQRRALSPRSRSSSTPNSDDATRASTVPRKRRVTVGAGVDSGDESKHPYERENSRSHSSKSKGGGVQFLSNHHVNTSQNSRMVLSIEDHPEYNTELVRRGVRSQKRRYCDSKNNRCSS
eukprot:TRINITY_DN5733_c0_g1_i1.p1 TRINITY_DN5733_c0_g1~~TRINITY_DN5733_c0_g1_i1.p1  ORF type:complete len:132 (-),score=11.85 TRINITY_DN5733_c0_g1_i1:651-1046(-)